MNIKKANFLLSERVSHSENFRGIQKILFFFICFGLFNFFLCHSIFAIQIKGIVKDSKKKILPSISVIVKRTGVSTITNLKGEFTIKVPDEWKTAVLLFQNKGYHPREVRVKVDRKLKVFKLFFIPQDSLLENVTVTALNRKIESIEVPVAESSISGLEILEKIPESIVETLSDTTGVHFIGSGGMSITPTIRGLARRRVLILVDGHRITSDRRAGTSPSFIPPEIVRSIEVVRSASSVLYGSDAIGGVVNILTRASARNTEINWNKNASFNLNFSPINNRFHTGLNSNLKLGNWNVYSGLQLSHSNNYFSREKEVLHSGYTYYSGIFDISHTDENSEFYLGYIGGIGKNIGKPNRDNDSNKYTEVPLEGNHMIRLGYTNKKLIKKTDVVFSIFLNPTLYKLEKTDLNNDKIEGSNTNGLNLGIKSSFRRQINPSFFLQTGLEWFSRQNVEIDNRLTLGDETSITMPLQNGTRNDYAFFVTLDYSITPLLHLDSGIRYTFFSLKADVEGEEMLKKTGSPSLFLGITQKLSDSVSIFINIARAFRFPSLSESFYTGLTGRKYVIGNPNLRPESSWDIDMGLKMALKRFSLGLYFFTNHISNMIERYKNENDIYTFDNIDSGRIYGGEIEAQYHPFTNLELSGDFSVYRGRSNYDDVPLNDVPAPRLRLGGKLFVDRVWIQMEMLHSFKKIDPGPAEIINKQYSAINIKGGIFFSENFSLFIKIANFLNQQYYLNADPDIPLAKGINFTTGIHIYL